MLTIKQIFHYQKIRESCLFSFTNEREQMRNENKKNKFIFNFFFQTKRKHVRIWDQYNLWKT